jgi:hypothetical protein
MPLLADPAAVMADLGFDSSMTNITQAAKSALRMATASLGAHLLTDFTQGAMVDVYFIDPDTVGANSGASRTEFWLSQGFVDRALPFSASYSASSVGLTTTGSRSDVSTAMTVNLERGVAMDVLNAYSGNWVQIAYSKGFPISADDPEIFDLTVVPEWLQTAATLLAKIFLQSNPSLEDPQIKMDTKLLQTQAHAIIWPHLRYAPAAYKPVLAAISGAVMQATATVPATAP